jgi:hypothetical protein
MEAHNQDTPPAVANDVTDVADALRIVLEKGLTDVGTRLKFENKFLTYKFSMISQTAGEKEGYYLELVRLARESEAGKIIRNQEVIDPPQNWSDELKAQFRRDVRDLKGDESHDFYYGFNVGCAILSRFYKSIADIDPSKIDEENMLLVLKKYPETLFTFELGSYTNEFYMPREGLMREDEYKVDWVAILSSVPSTNENEGDGTITNKGLGELASLANAIGDTQTGSRGELKSLLAENKMLKKKLDVIFNVGGYLCDHFFDLVWLARHPDSPVAPSIVEKLDQQVIRSALNGWGDWHHGFNSGGLAISRLYGSLAWIKLTPRDEEDLWDDEDDEGWEEQDYESFWSEQRDMAFDEFPFLDT